MARSQWQILWLLSRGTPTAEVAGVTGYSVNWVREIARRYREDGPAGMGDRRHRNPGAAPLLDAEQQEQLRAALARSGPERRPVDVPAGGRLDERGPGATGQSSSAAGSGCVASASRRNSPRPRETRADAAAQAAFKKGGSRRP